MQRTPLNDYRPIADGARVATKGAAIYDHMEGHFTYGGLHMRSITYDVSGPA